MGKQTTQERFERPSQPDLPGQRDDEHYSQCGAGKNDSGHERSFLVGMGELQPRAEALALAVDDMGHREGHVDDVAMAA